MLKKILISVLSEIQGAVESGKQAYSIKKEARRKDDWKIGIFS